MVRIWNISEFKPAMVQAVMCFLTQTFSISASKFFSLNFVCCLAFDRVVLHFVKNLMFLMSNAV